MTNLDDVQGNLCACICPSVRNYYVCVQGLPSFIIIIVNAHAYAYTWFSCDSYACTCAVVTALHVYNYTCIYVHTMRAHLQHVNNLDDQDVL